MELDGWCLNARFLGHLLRHIWTSVHPVAGRGAAPPLNHQPQHGAWVDGLSRAIVRDKHCLVMAPSNPLANWEKIADSFYRKIPVYDAIFDEDVELENYIVAGAPYGGAIGMALIKSNLNLKLTGMPCSSLS
jgi:hypothetical protein